MPDIETLEDVNGGGTRTCRVLVVDDHADSAAATTRLLQMRGYAARAAGGHAAALAAVRAGRFDVLVCDLALADGDGCDLLGAVRALYPPVRGVALTGHGYAADRERCERAGFARFLLKPVSIEELWAAVDAAAAGLACGCGGAGG